jgi:hypothetical protein
LAHLGAKPSANFIASLGLNRDLAIRAVRSSQAREEQSHEVIEFCDSGDCAFSPATTGPLLDADGGRYARDQIDVRSGELLDKLPGVHIHRIEESALSFSEE